MAKGLCLSCGKTIDWDTNCPQGYCNRCCADLCHIGKKDRSILTRGALMDLGSNAGKEAVEAWLEKSRTGHLSKYFDSFESEELEEILYPSETKEEEEGGPMKTDEAKELVRRIHKETGFLNDDQVKTLVEETIPRWIRNIVHVKVEPNPDWRLRDLIEAEVWTDDLKGGYDLRIIRVIRPERKEANK